MHHGVRLNYNLKPIVVKLGINDGFYTLSTNSAKPAIEGSVSYKLSDDKGILSARGEISFVNASDPFTAKDKKSQMKAGVEVGFLF